MRYIRAISFGTNGAERYRVAVTSWTLFGLLSTGNLPYTSGLLISNMILKRKPISLNMASEQKVVSLSVCFALESKKMCAGVASSCRQAWNTLGQHEVLLLQSFQQRMRLHLAILLENIRFQSGILCSV